MSDAHRDEIAKLEALYEEHPEGRIFTHLAEACRKAGELERAREVLTDGIERHPDYSSAHVVLGRVLMDQGEHDQARAEFERVLELDGQNLVAHRSLGDIARAEGRTDDALEHYRTLVDLEPSDTDVRDLVEELAGGGEPEPGEPDEAEPADVADAVVESPDEFAGAVEATDSVELGDADEPEAAPRDEADEMDEADELDEAAAWNEDDWTLSGDHEEDVEDGSAAVADGDDWAGDTGDEGVSFGADEEDDFAPMDLPDSGTGFEGADGAAPATGGDADVMTETIAQVYARQGLYDRAVEVYQQLVQARPDDDGLRERLAEMEEKAAAAAEGEEATEVGSTGPGVESTADEPEPADVEAEPVEAEPVEAEEWAAELDAGDGETAVEPMAGFESGELETDGADVAPLEGLETDELDPDTGLADADTTEESPEPEPELTAFEASEEAEGDPWDVEGDEDWDVADDEEWDVVVDEEWSEEDEEDETQEEDDESEGDRAADDGDWDVGDDGDLDAEEDWDVAAEEGEDVESEEFWSPEAEGWDTAEAEAGEAGEAGPVEVEDEGEEVAEGAVPDVDVEAEAVLDEVLDEAPDEEPDEELDQEPAEMEAEGVSAEEEPASPWTEDDWSGETESDASPYAWGEAEEGEADASPPIRDYLHGLLEWSDGSGAGPGEGRAESTPSVDAADAGSVGEAADASDAPTPGKAEGSDDDDDLEMFRSWLESLKQ